MNQLSQEKRAALKRLLAAGASKRAIAATLHISSNTALRYARMYAFSPICGCGQPSGHRGWCRVRLDYSPVRRGWLADRWGKRGDSDLRRTVDAATTAARAKGHDLGRFVWSASGAASMAFAACRICGKQVRVFLGDSQWERYQEWQRFAGNAVAVRCKTKEERAAEAAARQEKRSWHEGKRTLREVRRTLRKPSNSLSEASTPERSSHP